MAAIFQNSFIDISQTPDHVVAIHVAYRTDRYAVTGTILAQSAGMLFNTFRDLSQDVLRTLFIDTAPTPDNVTPHWVTYNTSFVTNISTIIGRGLLAVGIGTFLSNIAAIPRRAAYYYSRIGSQ